MNKLLREMIIRFSPIAKHRSSALFDKYVSSSRFHGAVRILKKIQVTRRIGLSFGDDVLIEGHSRLDAQGGIIIGDHCTIKKGISINSYDQNDKENPYKPVIIGSGNTIQKNLNPGSVISNADASKGLFEKKAELIFVLGTGRSGSKAMANILSQNESIQSYHDTFAPITVWASEYLKDPQKKEVIKSKITKLFEALRFPEKKALVFSNHKFSALIPVLKELFPEAKYIWMLRKADQFINSSYPRGWFRNEELGQKAHPREFLPYKHLPDRFNADNRPKAYWTGEIDKEQWEKMTAFERNCWYWAFWNKMIESALEEIPANRKISIKLEELSKSKNQIETLLNIGIHSIPNQRINAANYKKWNRKDWNEEMNALYDSYCGDLMRKWYGKN